MNKAFRFRLELTSEQELQCAKFAGCSRFVWNRALALRKAAWENENKSISRYELDASLPDLKNHFPWLSEAVAQSLQQVNKDLDQAFQNFFRRCKTGEAPGYPRFKKKGIHDSFRFPQGIHLRHDLNARWGLVKLPKLGIVKFRKTQQIQGTIQNATLSKLNGMWYISFSCKDVPVTPRIEASKSVGIDRGIAVFAAFSDGTLVKGPEPGRKAAHRLAKLQRNLSRKEKFSQNWKKTKAKIQRLYSHTAHIRKDFLQKLSTEIVKNHAVVVVEELKVRNMTRSAKGTPEKPGTKVQAKAGLNRSILDQGWHAFEAMLAYKLAWRSGELVKVPAAYSSQTCSSCGHCSADNRTEQARFRCTLCGYEAHADLNAAQNILAAGHVAKACGGKPTGAPTKQEAQLSKTA